MDEIAQLDRCTDREERCGREPLTERQQEIIDDMGQLDLACRSPKPNRVDQTIGLLMTCQAIPATERRSPSSPPRASSMRTRASGNMAAAMMRFAIAAGGTPLAPKT